METEKLLEVQEKENVKMMYKNKLDELREKYRGNPGQQEALSSFSYEDPVEGLKILNELEEAGLTPWDVGKIYGPMWGYDSQKSFYQKELERKILGSSHEPYPGDLGKVARYVIKEKKEREKSK